MAYPRVPVRLMGKLRAADVPTASAQSIAAQTRKITQSMVPAMPARLEIRPMSMLTGSMARSSRPVLGRGVELKSR